MKVYIGFDPRERDAYEVAAWSLRARASIKVEVEPLVLEHLRWKNVYTRPHEMREGRLWDAISGAPMATEFALTRFLVPHLAGYRGWSLYCDCDFLFLADVADLFRLADPTKAVQVVKHADYAANYVASKMDGQIQTAYARKNWSSFMLFNNAHDMHAGTLDRVAKWRGLWLHQFRWLQDPDIGELPLEWNWLEGISPHAQLEVSPPAAVHFTRGTPDMRGYEHVQYADEWRAARTHALGRHGRGRQAEASHA